MNPTTGLSAVICMLIACGQIHSRAIEHGHLHNRQASTNVSSMTKNTLSTAQPAQAAPSSTSQGVRETTLPSSTQTQNASSTAQTSPSESPPKLVVNKPAVQLGTSARSSSYAKETATSSILSVSVATATSPGGSKVAAAPKVSSATVGSTQAVGKVVSNSSSSTNLNITTRNKKKPNKLTESNLSGVLSVTGTVYSNNSTVSPTGIPVATGQFVNFTVTMSPANNSAATEPVTTDSTSTEPPLTESTETEPPVTEPTEAVEATEAIVTEAPEIEETEPTTPVGGEVAATEAPEVEETEPTSGPEPAPATEAPEVEETEPPPATEAPENPAPPGEATSSPAERSGVLLKAEAQLAIAEHTAKSKPPISVNPAASDQASEAAEAEEAAEQAA